MSEPQHNRGRSKQDYRTPPELLEAVMRRFSIGEFDIDLAATILNRVADRHYDIGDNALVQPWRRGQGWNWCNPPFAHIEPWVHRAYQEMVQHHASTIMLLPAGVGSNWFRDWVHEKAHVLFLNGRITFVGQKTCYPKDCILLVYNTRIGIYRNLPDYEVWPWAA